MNYKTAIEVNYELKFNVNELQDDIKSLQKQCDFNYEDYVQENTADKIPTKKEKKWPYVCLMCNKIFESNNGIQSCGATLVVKCLKIERR